ncbi:hypothetical protein [Nocardia asiatica]|uniref:hypothetical protein n=1 Tax=Nocardia asiatica TaxID=209252 RepID=UPI003EE2506B
MSLTRRTEVLLDAEVDLEPVAANPQPTPSFERRRFPHFPQPEHLDVEPPAFRLTAWRYRQLDVVQTEVEPPVIQPALPITNIYASGNRRHPMTNGFRNGLLLNPAARLWQPHRLHKHRSR